MSGHDLPDMPGQAQCTQCQFAGSFVGNGCAMGHCPHVTPAPEPAAEAKPARPVHLIRIGPPDV